MYVCKCMYVCMYVCICYVIQCLRVYIRNIPVSFSYARPHIELDSYDRVSVNLFMIWKYGNALIIVTGLWNQPVSSISFSHVSS